MKISIHNEKNEISIVIIDGKDGGALVVAASILQIPIRNAAIAGTSNNGYCIEGVEI